MKRFPILTRIAALAAVIVGSGAALALPAGADINVLSPPLAAVQIESPAILGARGAFITVPVTVVCASGGSGFLRMEVTETVGQDIALGSTFTDFGCTGGFQTVNVVVTAFDNPFKRGTAFAQADFEVCDNTGCSFGETDREIKITK
jgi:hypothetical protein